MTFIRMNPDLNQQALSCLLATKCLKLNFFERFSATNLRN